MLVRVIVKKYGGNVNKAILILEKYIINEKDMENVLFAEKRSSNTSFYVL